MGIRGLWEAEAQLTAVWGPWRLRRWKCDTLIPIPYPWGGGQGWGLLEAGPSEMRAPASAGREVSNCSLSAQPQLRKLVFSLRRLHMPFYFAGLSPSSWWDECLPGKGPTTEHLGFAGWFSVSLGAEQSWAGKAEERWMGIKPQSRLPQRCLGPWWPDGNGKRQLSYRPYPA